MKVEADIRYRTFYYVSSRGRKLHMRWTTEKVDGEIKEISSENGKGIRCIGYLNIRDTGSFYYLYEDKLFKSLGYIDVDQVDQRIYLESDIKRQIFYDDKLDSDITEADYRAIKPEDNPVVEKPHSKASRCRAIQKFKDLCEKFLVVDGKVYKKADEIPFLQIKKSIYRLDNEEKYDVEFSCCSPNKALDPVFQYRVTDRDYILRDFSGKLSPGMGAIINSIKIAYGYESWFDLQYDFQSVYDQKYQYDRKKKAYTCNLICYEPLEQCGGSQEYEVIFVRGDEHMSYQLHELPIWICTLKYMTNYDCAVSKFMQAHPDVSWKMVKEVIRRF